MHVRLAGQRIPQTQEAAMRGLVGLVISLLLLLLLFWVVVQVAELAVSGTVFVWALIAIAVFALIAALTNRRTVA